MPICPHCGMLAAETDVFCGSCGQRLSQPSQVPTSPTARERPDDTCPRCGQRVEAGDTFCGHCGQPLTARASGAAAPPRRPAAAPPVQQAPGSPTVQSAAPPQASWEADDADEQASVPAAAAPAKGRQSTPVAVFIVGGLLLLLLIAAGGGFVFWRSRSGGLFVPQAPLEPTPTPRAADTESTATPSPSPSPRPSATARPTVTPEPTGPAMTGAQYLDDHQFVDDFSSEALGWGEGTNDSGGGVGYVNGAYMIYDSASVFIYTVVPVDFAPIGIQFDAQLGDGREDGDYGVVCHRQDQGNKVLVRIDPIGGTYQVGQLVDDEWLDVSGRGWQSSSAIETGRNAVNTVLAECPGDEIGLFINEAFIGRWPLPTTRQPSDMMLYARAREKGEQPYEVIFDNVSAWGPVQ